MSCNPNNPGSTHFSGCACWEAAWQERLDAAARRIVELRDELAAVENAKTLDLCRELCEALGWQGGTRHDALREVAKMRAERDRLGKARRGQHMHGIDVCVYCVDGDIAARETVPALTAYLARCGDALGVAARTRDDGTVEEYVLAAKVPELVEALAAKLAESDAALREVLSLVTARKVVTAADVDAASAAVPDVVMRVRTCEARIEASEADAAAMREVLTEAADWIESAVDIISEDDEDDPDNDRARYVAERCRLLGDGAAGRKLLNFVHEVELATESLTGDGDNGCPTGEPEHLCAGCRQDVWHGQPHGDGCSVARLIVALGSIGVTIASGRHGRVVEASDA